MAEGSFFSRLFGLDDDDDFEEAQQSQTTTQTDISESTETTLQDVVNFVAELQSYYYNDICKMQADLLVETDLTKSEENFMNKKIKQEQIALKQIDEVLDLVRKNEREYQSIWGKSVYSFYDEIEKAKLSVVYQEVFEILLKLCEINTKPELESVILKRIKQYKTAWNIDSEISIPKNYNAIIVEENEGIEKYRFGDFYKEVYAIENERSLTITQLNELRALKFEFESTIPTDCVWVYISSVTRAQLNLMRKTCLIKTDWEYTTKESKSKLCFDIVKVKDLEQYLKGILQIILTRRIHAVISIFIPTNDMLRIIGPTNQKDSKVEICKKMRFILKERSGVYKDNLITARVDRRNIPEKLKFVSYLNFKRAHF